MNEPWAYDEENEEDQAVEETRPHRVRRRHDTRGNLYLLTGLVIGLAIGLLFAWVISPVKYSDIDPASLPSAQQDEYRQVIALAYAADHDLPRASARLNLIDSGSAQQVLAAQAQRMLANKQSAQDARALAILAADIGNPPVMEPSLLSQSTSGAIEDITPDPTGSLESSAVTLDAASAIQTPTLPLPTPTAILTDTPAPTYTPRPTATPLKVQNAPFTIKSNKEICTGEVTSGLLQIEVLDTKGEPLPGVRIVATWDDGMDSFYTGLSPDINNGYADFLLKPQTIYSLKVGDVSEPVNGIKIPACGGGLLLTFEEGKQ